MTLSAIYSFKNHTNLHAGHRLRTPLLMADISKIARMKIAMSFGFFLVTVASRWNIFLSELKAIQSTTFSTKTLALYMLMMVNVWFMPRLLSIVGLPCTIIKYVYHDTISKRC